MSCCAGEQILQCPECPTPGDGAAVVLAPTSSVYPTRVASVGPARTPAVADGFLAISGLRDAAHGFHPGSPPLYRLHAQLLI
jgi:poly(3-hydroxybutyrate) depolymerase